MKYSIKPSFFILWISTILFLSACGGGGGNSVDADDIDGDGITNDVDLDDDDDGFSDEDEIIAETDPLDASSFPRPYKIRVRTSETSTNSTSDLQFYIMTIGDGYNYSVVCDSERVGAGKATGVTGDYLCQYEEAGDYTISISGSFPQTRLEDDYGTDESNKLLSIEQWGTGKWRSMNKAFFSAGNMTYAATDIPNLTNVTDMSSMFLSANSFNGVIGKWDVSSVTDMSFMFDQAYSFNQELNDWDVSSVTDMTSMFSFTDLFNQNLNSWDVSSVTNMNSMFNNALEFDGKIDEWKVNAVTDMNGMFVGAPSFNQDISNWNVSSVTDMDSMFRVALSFNQNLSEWDVSSVTNMSNMFRGITLTPENYDGLLIGWRNQDLQENVNFSAGNSKVESEEGQEARSDLRDILGWIIIDGDLL